MQITGRTRVYGILGHPLRHTLSPAMHNAAFEALGLDCVYVPLPVAVDSFDQVAGGLSGMGLAGFNVTMPYKEQILPHLDDVASYAQIAGAVNTVQCVGGKLVGYNTDGRGFMAALERDAEFTVRGVQAIVLGAGGAACAAVLSMALSGARRITIVNRTPERAEQLAERVSGRFESVEVSVASPHEDLSVHAAAATLVVNATSVGMLDSPGMPIPAELLRPDQLVVDMIYEPRETDLLRTAASLGAKTMNGLGMLVYQAANAFEIWTEIQPPVDIMREAARGALAEFEAARARVKATTA